MPEGGSRATPLDLRQTIYIGLWVIEEASHEYRRPPVSKGVGQVLTSLILTCLRR